MAMTDSLRQPSGLQLLGAARFRQFWTELVRTPDETRQLPIAIRSDQPFEPYVPLAAAAERVVEEDAQGITWWLHMPGAGRNSTDVVWDPERRKLSVGAWSRRTGRNDARRLLWHSSMWQPDTDGARAAAMNARGWVGVRLPCAEPAEK